MYSNLDVNADPTSLSTRADDSVILENGGVARTLEAAVRVGFGPRGRGLFAARSFHAGERIIMERAFIWEKQKSDGSTNSSVWTPASLLPDDIDAALYQLAPFAATRVQPGEVMKRQDLLSATLSSNAFGVGSATSRGGTVAGAAGQGGNGRALFQLISMANHDCQANCRTLQIEEENGDDDDDDAAPPARVLEARRDICEGEELCISYIPATWSRPIRQSRLTSLWGFTCACSRCAALGGDDTNVTKCLVCTNGRVFGGSNMCVDCGEAVVVAGGGVEEPVAVKNSSDSELFESLTAPGTARELVTRLISHPTLAMEDIRVWLTACELLSSLARFPSLARELRSATRGAALRMQYVIANEWDILDEDESEALD